MVSLAESRANTLIGVAAANAVSGPGREVGYHAPSPTPV
ncbi:MAG: hypothetical protein ACYCO9_11970 [Streptosporangiaceae bacterium]